MVVVVDYDYDVDEEQGDDGWTVWKMCAVHSVHLHIHGYVVAWWPMDWPIYLKMAASYCRHATRAHCVSACQYTLHYDIQPIRDPWQVWGTPAGYNRAR